MPRAKRAGARQASRSLTRAQLDGSSSGAELRRGSFSDANENEDSAREEAGDQLETAVIEVSRSDACDLS